ncbi:hypothetical protein CAPTEDRAFT_225183 [Capitella teleta]|uniref:Ig-like domain-containing protein n=1 Tax=Capitella teleta TaxID=283909 RepID=R7VJU6_CAPTE|nr:hypothetical protein CAPTEDRAFT_225183 [Capitella teleta]|eukprot:ELU16796.1 hypothetical protein CAPTEDRAFT_225183 [Capitella teleta]
MDATTTVFVLLTVLVGVITGQQLLSVHPERDVLLTGQHLQLNCDSLSLSPQMTWKFHSMQDGSSHIITDNGGQGGAQYSITVTESESHVRSTLHVDGITTDQGGIFVCQDLRQPSVTPKTASVVVLGSDPVCSLTPENPVEGENVTLNCQILSAGQWMPSMEWTGPQGVIPMQELIVEKETHRLSVSYRVEASRNMDFTLFNSRTFFNKPTQEPLPYSFSHHFHALQVQYPAGVLTVDPIKDVYNPGDRVACVSDGYPTPTVEWRDDKSILRCQGSVLLITKEMEGHREFSCFATSTIRDRPTYVRKTMKLFVHVDEAAPSMEKLVDPEDNICVMHPLEVELTTSQEGLENTSVFAGSADSFGSPQEEATGSILLIPIAIASVALLLVILGVACFCSTKHRRQKQGLESCQNLNNDVYLRTCGGDARGVQPNHAQPNQYATAFGVQDPESAATAGFKKSGEEEDFDDNSSGFYSELIAPEDLPIKRTPEPPALRRDLSPFSQASQDIGEDGYLMPQLVLR